MKTVFKVFDKEADEKHAVFNAVMDFSCRKSKAKVTALVKEWCRFHADEIQLEADDQYLDIADILFREGECLFGDRWLFKFDTNQAIVSDGTDFRVEWQDPKNGNGVWTDVTSKIWEGHYMVFDEETLNVGILSWRKKHPNGKIRFVKTIRTCVEV